MPAEAKGTSAASAKAFVRYWTETLNYAGNTGKTGDLAAISDPACGSCSAVISSIQRVYSKGGYYRGEGWSIATLELQPLQPKRRPVITAGVHIAPQVLVERKGAKTQRFEGGNRSMIFRLAAAGNYWTVVRLDQPS
jgi:hypothetical protein